MEDSNYLGSATIRKASLDDSSEIARLMTQLGYPTSIVEMHERLVVILSHPDYSTFVVESSGTIVGMVGACVGYSYETNGPYGRIAALIVDESWRSRGIGAALVKEVERWLGERGADAIVVNSRQHRHEAHRFYKRLGYEETGVRLVKLVQ